MSDFATWSGEAVFIYAIAKAILIEYEGKKVWVPLSLWQPESTIGPGSGEGEVGELVVPKWMANQMGWC